MANHSILKTPKPVEDYDIESALLHIIARRFPKLEFFQDAGRAKRWEIAHYWMVEAPGTRPEPLPQGEPDEDLGFEFWLHPDMQTIEVRHPGGPAWIVWIHWIVTHELARSLGIERLDPGDGDLVPTNPEQYLATHWEYRTRHFQHPLTPSDHVFLVQRSWLTYTPEGWA